MRKQAQRELKQSSSRVHDLQLTQIKGWFFFPHYKLFFLQKNTVANYDVLHMFDFLAFYLKWSIYINIIKRYHSFTQIHLILSSSNHSLFKHLKAKCVNILVYVLIFNWFIFYGFSFVNGFVCD